MSYYRRVVKRRPACLTDAEWLEVVERGKLPRPDFKARDGSDCPPVDVYDLVFEHDLRKLRWRLERLCMALVEPKIDDGAPALSTSSAKIGSLLMPFSGIWEFLTLSQYQSGKKRKTGRLSLSLASEGLKVTLTDDTSGTYACRTAETLDDALLALEVALGDGTLKWAKSSFNNGRK